MKRYCLICKQVFSAPDDGAVFDVCESCREDAALGLAVRQLSRDDYNLYHREKLWGVTHRQMGTLGTGKTPEDALMAAGLMDMEVDK